MVKTVPNLLESVDLCPEFFCHVPELVIIGPKLRGLVIEDSDTLKLPHPAFGGRHTVACSLALHL